MSLKKSGFLPLDVIKEVRKRPGIYDKKALIAPRTEHRQQLWMEVAESVTPPEEWETFTQEEKETRVCEVSNKWKNLRDHFYRDVKRVESGESNKRKYVYYDDMAFVRPFIGYKLPPRNKRQITTSDSLNNSQEYKEHDTDMDMDDFLKPNKKSFKQEEVTINERVAIKTKPVLKRKPKFPKHRVSATNSSAKEVFIKNFDVLKKTGDSKNPTFKIRESDISFCISLAPTLRELVGARKLSAKIDILKVLHKHLHKIERNRADNDYDEYESGESVYNDKGHNTAEVKQNPDIEEVMTEDHLEDYDEVVIVKTEAGDDPLNGNTGNSKT